MSARGSQPANRIRQRNLVDRVLGPGARAHAVEGSWLQRIVEPKWKQLRESTNVSQSVDSNIRLRLLKAGFPYGLTVRDFVLLKRVLAVLAALAMVAAFGLAIPWVEIVLTWAFSVRMLIGSPWYGMAAFVGFAAGYTSPDIWIALTARQRAHDMQRTLPDMIDLLTVSVEAGLGLVAAMQEVASGIRGPLGEEITRVISEMRLGRTLAEALRDMAARLQIDDFSQFVSQLIQADQLGISIGNALRAQSAIMRERRRQRAEESAQKAPVKMMIPLIFFILPTLFIIIMGPAAIMAFRELQNTPII